MARKTRNDGIEDDEKFESTKHREERAAAIREELEQNQGVSKELAENQEIANFKGLPQEGETREQLLDRIRKMREKPEPTPTELFRSEGQQKEYDAEVKAGQEAVAKATAERDKLMAASVDYEKGEKNKAG